MPLPSFQIDQAQLRELRIAKRWTAESAAMELRCQLGKAVEPANVKQAHSATVAYQRLERTGKTSLKTAQAPGRHVFCSDGNFARKGTHRRREAFANHSCPAT